MGCNNSKESTPVVEETPVNNATPTAESSVPVPSESESTTAANPIAAAPQGETKVAAPVVVDDVALDVTKVAAPVVNGETLHIKDMVAYEAAIKLRIDPFLIEMFQNLDADGSGSLDKGEIKIIIDMLEWDFLDDEGLDALIARCDGDGNGQISIEEFATMMDSESKALLNNNFGMAAADIATYHKFCDSNGTCNATTILATLKKIEPKSSFEKGLFSEAILLDFMKNHCVGCRDGKKTACVNPDEIWLQDWGNMAWKISEAAQSFEIRSINRAVAHLKHRGNVPRK
jgi:hypothetical protein